MAISLGNIVGNKVVGIASGLDSTALIEGLVASRKKPITDLQTKITTNTTKNSTYASLSTALTSLKSSLNFLRNPIDSAENAFEARTVSLSSATLTASGYLSVTASPGALIGTNEIQIGQLAKAKAERSDSFNSRNTDATTVATGSYFTAGTFKVGSAIVSSVTGGTKSGFQLDDADYSVDGASTGILTGGGISAINVVGASGGQTGLEGTISGITGTYSAGNVVLSFSKAGVTYTSNSINAGSAIGGDTGITSGTVITFTADAAGVNETSFQITTSSDVVINASQTNTNTFATNLNTALSTQSIYQSRKISNFVDANVQTPLTGLTNNHIRFVSNAFSTTGTFGSIEGFDVQYNTGATDGSISVIVNGETFRVTGLGDTVNTNLTLQSTTTDKQLKINLGTAGVSLDLSTEEDASQIERALDYAFGTRELVDVTVNSGDSLNDIVYNLNSLSARTGASSSITQVSNFDYRVNLKANKTGLDNQYDIFDGSGVLTNADFDSTEDAQDAKIKIDGIEITRSTNTITDGITNTTLNLLAVTPDYGLGGAESVNVQIDNDVDTEVALITNFINAYNAIRVFNSEQTQRDSDGVFTEDAILGGDSLLSSLITQLSDLSGSTVGDTSSSEFDALADIGITLEDFPGDSETVATKNIMVLDDTKLRNALSSNLSFVRQIFEAQSTTSSSKLSVFQTSNVATLSEFKLYIDNTQPVGEQVKLQDIDGVDILDGLGDPIYLDASGTTITGRSGTPVDGLKFIYTGDGTDTISVNIVQGLADQIYNLADSYTRSGGIIDDQVQGNTDANTAYTSKIIELQARLDSYTKTLQSKYSKLEQSISTANNILALLQAQSDVINGKN